MMRVPTPEGSAGLLAKEDVYRFAYSAQRSPDTDILLTMPGRLQSCESQQLHPIFQMNMPEGDLPDDAALALSLDGSKSIFAVRLGLLRFMANCGLSKRQGSLA